MRQATAAELRKNTAGIIRAPRRMPVAEAVHKYMRVPVGVGNSVEWDPNLAPYVVEPMNCLASREYDAVIFVGPARTGKTIGLIDGWVVYNVVCDPSDMLIIQMTEEKAREHSKKRLARTFRVSPEVACRLSPSRNDNNVHDRTFLAGNYLKIGWPSINIMSSSDFKCVALTDYDRFPEDIDGEGDGFSLASKRTTTFMSAGMTLVESSPGREITNTKWRRKSPHEAPPTTGILSLYNRGDRRRWYWPCPHCGEYFQPAMEAMTGYRETSDPVKASEAAHIDCPHCSGMITADRKRELNGKGVWLREGQTIDREGNITGDARRSRIASFWMEGPAAAYQTWAQLVYKLLTAEQDYEATGSEETLKTVINTDWGLPYLPRAASEQRRADVLMLRAEDYGKRLVPPKVRFLLASVDVQGGKKRRFVVQIIGYGENGERWLVDRYNIRQSLRCDENGEAQHVHPGSYPEDWQLLITDVLEKTYALQSDPSRWMPILAMAVDSGGEDGVTDIHSVRHDRIPKCRVDLGDIITTWLPLCQGFSGTNRADSNPYAVGDAVTVLSEAGDLNNGRVFPGWNTGKLPVPEGSDSEHITRYSDGTEIRYDRNAHALTITLADGGTYKIVGKGTLDGPVEITDTLTVQGKTQINADTSVAGNIGASKEITDKSGSMSKIREVFNNHDHRGDSGGLTDKPNQKM